jgi:hypothetical protein
VTGKRNKIYETVSHDAMAGAEHSKETDPTWVWSNTQPPQP